MTVHAHSAEAYFAELPKLNRRAAAILHEIRENGKGTDREIMRRMGFTDPNAVRPRITELVDAKLLEEVGETTCPITRKTVRVVDVPRKPQRELFAS